MPVRINKLMITVIVVLFSSVSLLYAQVEITDSGAREVTVEKFCGKGPFIRTARYISVKNQSPVDYQFTYNYFADPVFKEKHPGKPFPYIGDATAHTSGLGLSWPWYGGGFMGVDVNKKLLQTIIAKEINIVEQGKRGVIDIIWEPDWAKIKARFVVLPGDDRLYTEITLDPKGNVSSLGMRFFCIPGHHGTVKPRESWCSTIKRSVKLTGGYTPLDPKEEPWIFYFDTQSNKNTGTGVLMYLPEQVTGVTVNHGVSTRLSLSPELRKVRFVFWRFPDGYKKPEEAYEYLKENSKESLEKLRKFKFEL